MSKPIHEGHGLYGLSKAHLISQDDIGTSTPVVSQEVHALELERPQLTELDVIGLRIQFYKLATSVEIRFSGV